MRRSSITNRPRPDLHAEPADVHRPLEPASNLRARLARAATDRDRRAIVDDQHGRDENREHDHNGAHAAVDGRQSRVCYSTTTSGVPASTDCPSDTNTSRTRPSRAARSSFSIFIASTTTSP